MPETPANAKRRAAALSERAAAMKEEPAAASPAAGPVGTPVATPRPVPMVALRPVPHALYTEGHAPNGRVARGGAFTAPSQQVADDLAAAGFAQDA